MKYDPQQGSRTLRIRTLIDEPSRRVEVGRTVPDGPRWLRTPDRFSRGPRRRGGSTSRQGESHGENKENQEKLKPDGVHLLAQRGGSDSDSKDGGQFF